ncbi:hypothetical protein K431DRAFT_283878 [Polychaeton citri CBS 116435]|uniref:Uncharacterized protein n=1 Tax=Polychaeton citri CBS 116435 TaxID=1314669 RepID=A0A9P4QAL1_9PEZI|nr:hypothetical protein K431DRAFT_283878 [Polychaeton citri CBS 116435]
MHTRIRCQAGVDTVACLSAGPLISLFHRRHAAAIAQVLAERMRAQQGERHRDTPDDSAPTPLPLQRLDYRCIWPHWTRLQVSGA